MKEDGKVLNITYNMIKNMKKGAISHRAALDHNKSYLDRIIKKERLNVVEIVVFSKSKSLPCKRAHLTESSKKRTRSKRKK